MTSQALYPTLPAGVAVLYVKNLPGHEPYQTRRAGVVVLYLNDLPGLVPYQTRRGSGTVP